jgi:hypothetical protein
MRRAFGIAEFMVAFFLIGGPLLIVVHLTQSTTHGSHLVQERTSARLCLVDVIELLMGETPDRLREMAGEDGRERFATILADRIERLPPHLREQYGRQVAPLRGQMSCRFEEGTGELPELARLAVHVVLQNGSEVSVSRLFRPAAVGP